MTTRRNTARSYSDHIFSVSSQCRKNASTVRTMPSSATLPSPSDPNVADCRLKLSASQCSLPGTPTVRRMQGGRRDLSATIAQCSNLEHEIRHTLSKLCILGFEPLEWSLIAAETCPFELPLGCRACSRAISRLSTFFILFDREISFTNHPQAQYRRLKQVDRTKAKGTRIDEQRSVTAQPSPLWRLRSGPQSQPIDPEMFGTQAPRTSRDEPTSNLSDSS